MKKLLSVLLIIATICAVASCTVKSPNEHENSTSSTGETKSSVEEPKTENSEVEYDSERYMCYKLNDDGKSYTAFPYNLPDVVKELVFPGEYKGLPVTKISGGLHEKSIETIIISEGIREINASLDNCFDLKNIYIPASVTYIWQFAFNSQGTMGEFPSSVKSNVIENIVVAEGNRFYYVDGNCLIEKSSKKIILGCNNSIIPTDGSVKIIGEAAFANCKSMETVVIPKSVIDLEYAAFDNCGSLKKVYFTSSVSIDKKVVNFDTETVFGYSEERNFYVPDAETLEIYSTLFGPYTSFEIGIPHDFTLTEQQAKKIALDYWNEYNYLPDPEIGSPYSVIAEFEANVYHVYLNNCVQGQDVTLDTITIDAYTGKILIG